MNVGISYRTFLSFKCKKKIQFLNISQPRNATPTCFRQRASVLFVLTIAGINSVLVILLFHHDIIGNTIYSLLSLSLFFFLSLFFANTLSSVIMNKETRSRRELTILRRDILPGDIIIMLKSRSAHTHLVLFLQRSNFKGKLHWIYIFFI